MFYVLQDGLLKAVHSSKWRVARQFCANARSAAQTYKFGEVDSCNDCRF